MSPILRVLIKTMAYVGHICVHIYHHPPKSSLSMLIERAPRFRCNGHEKVCRNSSLNFRLNLDDEDMFEKFMNYQAPISHY